MDIMEIITEKMAFGGNSIAKVNGKTLFVPFSMPGEKLSVRITESKRDYDVCEIVQILEASEHRVQPTCQYYGICGGCNMMHIDYEHQKELRKQMLYDILKNNGIEYDIENIKVIEGPATNYRARFQFHDGGLSAKNSNTIIPINQCQIAETPVNNYLANTPKENRPKGRVHVFGSQKISELTPGSLKIAQNFEENKAKDIIPKSKKDKFKKKENHYFAGTAASPENRTQVLINGKKLAFDVRGFFQSNLYVFEKTVQLIQDILFNSEKVLDMYAGCGSLSVFAAEKAKEIILVEHNRDALVFAEENLAGVKHTSFGLSGESWVKNCSASCGHFDSVIIDPPRSGMERSVADYIIREKIPQIISLSCDPATQGRDIARLIKGGYEINGVYLLDFYPNSSHIESLIELRLKI